MMIAVYNIILLLLPILPAASLSLNTNPRGALSQATLHAPTSPPNDLTSFVEGLRVKYRVPGFSLAIVKKGEHGWEEFVEGFGTANVQGEPVTEQSLFSIASNSKLFTVLATGLLIENGTVLPNGQLLGWNDKIKDILPDWKLMDQYMSDHVDLVDLLSHRSGLPRHDNAHDDGESAADVVSRLEYLRPSYEIREKWQYNNQGYITVAHIIATLSGIPFDQYVTKHILHPLNMTDTTYNATWAYETGHRTDGFARVDRNVTLCADKWSKDRTSVDESCLGTPKSLGWWTNTDGLFEDGAGGVITSSRDMSKWLRELVEPTVIPRHLIDLTGKAIEVANDAPQEPEESLIAYGLAQEAWSYRGVNLIGHTGSLPGQRSILIRVPDQSFALMVTTNDEDYGVPILKTIAYRVIDELAGLTKFPWEDRLMGRSFEINTKPRDVPENPNPPPAEKDIVGVYSDKGYGNFTLQPAERPAQLATMALPLNVTGPIYIAEMNKVFVSHLIFTHWSGGVFNWTLIRIYDTLGKDRQPTGEPLLPVGWVETGSAILDGRGLGMFGNYWGAEGDRGTISATDGSSDYREKANLWFDRVSTA